MHLPYPSPRRKSSNPSPFLPASSSAVAPFGQRFTLPRRYRQHAIAIGTLFLLALLWLLTHGGSSSRGARRGGGGGSGAAVGMANHVPTGKPPAVIVTVLDEKRFGAKYTELLKENRRLYAEKHGMLRHEPGWEGCFACGRENERGGRGKLDERD